MRADKTTFETKLAQWLTDDSLMRALLSAPKTKDMLRVKIVPVSVRGEKGLQLEFQEPGGKVRHANLAAGEAVRAVIELMEVSFGQLNAVMWGQEAQAVVKKDCWLITEHEIAREGKASETVGHDREKNRLIADGQPLSFLIELGIMTSEGRVKHDMMAKFRQINRFLELVRDVLPELPQGRLRIIDFGCGKSYLTFALHHYMTSVIGREVDFTGIDLKRDVIEHCQSLAKRTGARMSFICGDAHEVAPDGADLVVSLHACDTATDAALACAVRLKAKAVLSVPCCHHELTAQARCDSLGLIMKHGILRQRLCEIATDALRAQLLEIHGYTAQVIEFIDPDATAKNLMIRAVHKKGGARQAEAKRTDYRALVKMLGVDPALGRALDENVADPAGGGQRGDRDADERVQPHAGQVVDA